MNMQAAKRSRFCNPRCNKRVRFDSQEAASAQVMQINRPLKLNKHPSHTKV